MCRDRNLIVRAALQPHFALAAIGMAADQEEFLLNRPTRALLVLRFSLQMVHHL
jgi:hypothetical protein